MKNHLEWIELTIAITADCADAVASFLIEQGSSGIVEEKSPKQNNVVILTAYLKNDESLTLLIQNIRTYLNGLRNISVNSNFISEITVHEIPDEDWNKKWKSFFQPIKVTDHIVIKPSWRDYRKKHDEVVIELDPGMAFGTGTHPSTRMCLRAIENITEGCQEKTDLSLLDVGTGSGILAIASALLGLQTITGIDTDYQAIESARKNAAQNKTQKLITFSTQPLKKITGTFSLVVANILPHILIDMQPLLLSHLKDSGYLILSGILKEKASEVTAVFLQSLTLHEKLEEEEWVCLIFKRNA